MSAPTGTRRPASSSGALTRRMLSGTGGYMRSDSRNSASAYGNALSSAGARGTSRAARASSQSALQTSSRVAQMAVAHAIVDADVSWPARRINRRLSTS